ncbi:MAG: FG-GAP repeat domain-containing protein, partial [Nannocystales bacterium]
MLRAVCLVLVGACSSVACGTAAADPESGGEGTESSSGDTGGGPGGSGGAASSGSSLSGSESTAAATTSEPTSSAGDQTSGEPPLCEGDVALDGFTCSCACEEGQCLACGRFEMNQVDWAVPDGERFEQIASNLHATFDLNGDGLPDLVNAGNYADFEAYGSSGERYWRVFLNEGDSFGPEQQWPVPDGQRFEQIASNLHATFDLDGDGLPDLVNAGNYADFE